MPASTIRQDWLVAKKFPPRPPLPPPRAISVRKPGHCVGCRFDAVGPQSIVVAVLQPLFPSDAIFHLRGGEERAWLRYYDKLPERDYRTKVIISVDTAAKDGAQNDWSAETTGRAKSPLSRAYPPRRCKHSEPQIFQECRRARFLLSGVLGRGLPASSSLNLVRGEKRSFLQRAPLEAFPGPERE